MRDLNRRVDRIEAAAPPGGCRDGWHAEAGKLAVVYGDDTPPPVCPSCAAEPLTVIRVVYEKGWRRLNDTPLSRTTIEW